MIRPMKLILILLTTLVTTSCWQDISSFSKNANRRPTRVRLTPVDEVPPKPPLILVVEEEGAEEVEKLVEKVAIKEVENAKIQQKLVDVDIRLPFEAAKDVTFSFEYSEDNRIVTMKSIPADSLIAFVAPFDGVIEIKDNFLTVTAANGVQVIVDIVQTTQKINDNYTISGGGLNFILDVKTGDAVTKNQKLGESKADINFSVLVDNKATAICLNLDEIKNKVDESQAASSACS